MDECDEKVQDIPKQFTTVMNIDNIFDSSNNIKKARLRKRGRGRITKSPKKNNQCAKLNDYDVAKTDIDYDIVKLTNRINNSVVIDRNNTKIKRSKKMEKINKIKQMAKNHINLINMEQRICDHHDELTFIPFDKKHCYECDRHYPYNNVACPHCYSAFIPCNNALCCLLCGKCDRQLDGHGHTDEMFF
jgi:hypothetical protein